MLDQMRRMDLTDRVVGERKRFRAAGLEVVDDIDSGAGHDVVIDPAFADHLAAAEIELQRFARARSVGRHDEELP